MESLLVLVSIPFLSFLVISLSWFRRCRNQVIPHWPIIGALPSLLWNSDRLIEWINEVFSWLGCGTFFLHGPVFSKLNYLVTCNPQNLEYILKTNFSNFPKGPDFHEVFDILGDGILNADHDSWRFQRKLTHACFNSAEFRSLVAKMSKKMVQNVLVPFLSHVAREGFIIDLQDICTRLTFDINMSVIYGREEGYLSIDLKGNEFAEAIDDAHESVIYRHILPTFWWKFLRYLNVGTERKLAKAWKTVDLFAGKYISLKRESLLHGLDTNDLLSMYIKSVDESFMGNKFLRDAMLNVFSAGKDAIASGLVWFLWLVAKTPSVEQKIVEELKSVVSNKEQEDKGGRKVFDADDLKGLVYLHAALCESLRLYSPVPLNSKSVLKEDVLPDGTVVKPGIQILLSFYSEGQMPWIWGEDSLDFKPERWIDDEGNLSHEPLSRFFAFNVGPRSCLAKNISFVQMKAIVAALLFNFHVELVEGHPIKAKPFVNLNMKHGLLVRIKERML